MTCIAYDGRYIACDKQASIGEMKTTTRKLFLDPKRMLAAGCAGNSARVREFHEWLRRGRPMAAFPPFQRTDDALHVLVIDRGVPFFYGSGCMPIRIEQPFFATGSGSPYAMGAMARGATAIEAVEIANQWDTGCGRGVDWAALGA